MIISKLNGCVNFVCTAHTLEVVKMAASHLKIENLNVSIEGKHILRDFSLDVKGGEIHAIMGPNGTGKSTLASAIMGHPKYEITSGSIHLDGEDVREMEVDERAQAGLFLAM